MESVIFYDKRHMDTLIHLRQGERKIGERVCLLEPGEGLEDLSECAKKGIRFALLGIPESIGPMANYGKCCTDHAWPAFLEAFLNMQSNQFYRGNDLLCLGELNTKEINEAAFLLVPGGLNSGFMIAQYTAAALVSENKVLCHPACVDSIPTSANKEDHVSMGMTSARKCREIVQNAEYVAVIELLCAAQALDLFTNMKPGEGTLAAYQAIRREVPHLEKDRVLSEDIEKAVRLMRSGVIIDAVEKAVGLLK